MQAVLSPSSSHAKHIVGEAVKAYQSFENTPAYDAQDQWMKWILKYKYEHRHNPWWELKSEEEIMALLIVLPLNESSLNDVQCLVQGLQKMWRGPRVVECDNLVLLQSEQ